MAQRCQLFYRPGCASVVAVARPFRANVASNVGVNVRVGMIGVSPGASVKYLVGDGLAVGEASARVPPCANRVIPTMLITNPTNKNVRIDRRIVPSLIERSGTFARQVP